MPASPEHIQELVDTPSEGLTVELKDWCDSDSMRPRPVRAPAFDSEGS